jgi:hypothetical protein
MGLFEDFADETGEEFAVDVVRAVLVGPEGFDLGGYGAGVDLCWCGGVRV